MYSKQLVRPAHNDIFGISMNLLPRAPFCSQLIYAYICHSCCTIRRSCFSSKIWRKRKRGVYFQFYYAHVSVLVTVAVSGVCDGICMSAASLASLRLRWLSTQQLDYTITRDPAFFSAQQTSSAQHNKSVSDGRTMH